MQRLRHAHGRIAAALAVATLLALAGCAGLDRRVEPPPPTTLHLLSSGPLELPSDCEPADGEVYRTHFIVETDGRVTAVRAEFGDGCVQQALRTWVSSFRYAPVGTAMPAVLDWLAVTATRGS